MDRDFRFKISGLAFYVLFILNLALTTEGKNYFNQLFTHATPNGQSFLVNLFEKSPTDTNALLITLAIGALTIFSSEPVGYVFSSIFQYFFNLYGGYSKMYKSSIGDIKQIVMKKYDELGENEKIITQNELDFKMRCNEYNSEQYLIFFFWHCPNGVNDKLHDWVVRRFNAYYASWTFAIAEIIAILFSTAIIFSCDLGFTFSNTIVIDVAVILLIISLANGELAKKDAISITDFQIAKHVNPRIDKIIKDGFIQKKKDNKLKENAK